MANKKAKKVTLESIREVLKTVVNEETVSWNGLDIAVKKVLSLDEMNDFYHYVVLICCGEDTESFKPQLREVAIRLITVALYTNITMPKDINEAYDILYAPGLFEAIIEHIDGAQYCDIIDSIDDGIEYLANSNIEGIKKDLIQQVASFEDLESKLSDMFSDIDADSIKKMITTLGEGVDERKLLEAFEANK